MRTFLAIIVVGALALVFWRGWVQFNVANKADQTETTLTINKDVIKQDLENLKQQRLVASAPANEFAETTIFGRVQTLAQDQITVLSSNGQTVNVNIVPETTILLGNRSGSISDLHMGDTVTVQQVVRENRSITSSIKVENRKE